MIMKRRTINFLAATAVTSMFFFSCNNGKTKQYGNMEFDSIKIDHTAGLLNDTASPSCNLRIDFVYPVKCDNAVLLDSVKQALPAYSFGKKYREMDAKAAIDSFRNAYVQEYRSDLAPLYREDLKNNGGKESVEAWYSYYQTIEARPLTDNPDYLTYIINTSEYRGGAHGTYATTYLNFDAANGRLMRLNDVFKPDYQKGLNELLLKKLMQQTGCATLEELEDKAYLQDTDMYPSNDFRLGKDSIYFLYNIYEIAPYSTGITEIALPYDELRKLMKKQEHHD